LLVCLIAFCARAIRKVKVSKTQTNTCNIVMVFITPSNEVTTKKSILEHQYIYALLLQGNFYKFYNYFLIRKLNNLESVQGR